MRTTFGASDSVGNFSANSRTNGKIGSGVGVGNGSGVGVSLGRGVSLGGGGVGVAAGAPMEQAERATIRAKKIAVLKALNVYFVI